MNKYQRYKSKYKYNNNLQNNENDDVKLQSLFHIPKFVKLFSKDNIDTIIDRQGRIFNYFFKFNILECLSPEFIVTKRQRNMYKALKLINLNKLEASVSIKQIYPQTIQSSHRIIINK